MSADQKQQRFGNIAAAMQACRRRSSCGGSDFDNNISRAIIRSEAFGAARKSGSQLTLRWREMDSNFWYRGTKAVDFCRIPGIAGVSAGLLNDTT
jgi:hypothetical protein